MNAKKAAWGENSRIKLADILPLETPLSIGIEASSICNLKCQYCAQSVSQNNQKFPKQLLSYDVFKKAIDSLEKFNCQLKNIVFAVLGEPLLNQQLPEMIDYVKCKNVSEKITVFSNAILLSKQTSQALIDAGLDSLRISIQGVSKERYLQLCNTVVDYEQIIKNVRNFFDYRNASKSNCHIFVKTFEQSLLTQTDEEKFYRDFGDICDQISIETIVEEFSEVDYSHIDTDQGHNLIRETVQKSDICAQPFYALYLRANGNITPCCIANSTDLVLGNAAQDSLFDIWNGNQLKDFQKMHLKRNRYQHTICGACNYPECGMQNADRIDDIAQRLYMQLIN